MPRWPTTSSQPDRPCLFRSPFRFPSSPFVTSGPLTLQCYARWHTETLQRSHMLSYSTISDLFHDTYHTDQPQITVPSTRTQPSQTSSQHWVSATPKRFKPREPVNPDRSISYPFAQHRPTRVSSVAGMACSWRTALSPPHRERHTVRFAITHLSRRPPSAH